jgi:hypothetical protein
MTYKESFQVEGKDSYSTEWSVLKYGNTYREANNLSLLSLSAFVLGAIQIIRKI